MTLYLTLIFLSKAVYYLLMLVLWILAIIGASALVVSLYELRKK